MKREKVDARIEEKIITAMITSREFLAQMAPSLDIDLVRAEHFRIIAKWCIRYFSKYKEAPGQHIETMYNSWAGKGKAKEETIEAVHDLLEDLSDRHEQEESLNVPYLLDEAADYFSLRKLELLRDNLDSALLEKDTTIAESIVGSHRAVRTGPGVGIDILRDETALSRAFSASQQPLFTIGPERVQRFFAHAFSRDGLIAVLAPEKRGKTFWCVEFSIRGLMARKKVALFEVGDMSESQIVKRIGVRFSGRPMYKSQCGKIRIPVKIAKRNRQVKVKRKMRLIKTPTTEKLCRESMRKFMRRFGISDKHTYYMTSVHPNSSVSVSDIVGILDKWEIENDFVPDIIIIDYPDILADEPNTQNYSTRDKENIKWKALRRLSQERHCLVIAPTQADAASYDVHTLTAKNFSEDKRKLAHVTGMLGLNQHGDEKEHGIMRLNWIVLREAPFSIDKQLYVGQCLPLARSFCCGYY